ncbi:MAG: hypothetical protein ABJQ71_15915 [Roseibium sp.]
MIVSINDTPEIRESFAGHVQKAVGLTYTVTETAVKEFGEHPLLKEKAAL